MYIQKVEYIYYYLVGNVMEHGEIAQFDKFLLFPQCFQLSICGKAAS